MPLTLITPPAVEPVTLADAKNFLRISITDDDALIGTLITAARMYCEKKIQRQLISATWLMTYDLFPWATGVSFPLYPELNPAYQANQLIFPVASAYGILTPSDARPQTLPNWGNIALPKPPLQSVSSIQYFDGNGVLQTWGAGNYQVVASNEPGLIRPQAGFPALQPNTAEAVKITFVAGYGADGTTVPGQINMAIRLLVAQWYEQRMPAEVGGAIAQSVDALLSQYRFEGNF